MKDKPSLLIIGNSNVGKSSITRLLLSNPKLYKGKTGKTPGSTKLIKAISQDGLPYKIVDLPGFGFMRSSSKRREEDIKQRIINHIEKRNKAYFFGLVVINILRIEDELEKYYYQNKDSIPLSFELINFIIEYEIPILIIINKIDKVSKIHQNRIIKFFIETANTYGINLVKLENFTGNYIIEIPYLEFSATKQYNLGQLRNTIHIYLQKYRD